MPVVAAIELEDAITTGGPSGEAHRAHDGLGARRDEPNLLETRDGPHDGLGKEDLTGGRSPEGGALGCRLGDRCDDPRVGVAEKARPVGLDEVEVLPALDVGDRGARATHPRVRSPTDGPE